MCLLMYVIYIIDSLLWTVSRRYWQRVYSGTLWETGCVDKTHVTSRCALFYTSFFVITDRQANCHLISSNSVGLKTFCFKEVMLVFEISNLVPVQPSPGVGFCQRISPDGEGHYVPETEGLWGASGRHTPGATGATREHTAPCGHDRA